MDINALKAKLQAKKEQQEKEWQEMTARRKAEDEKAVKKLMADVTEMTQKTFNDAARKVFGSYWKQ